MAGDRELRLKAGFALAKSLGEAATRATFNANGYADERQIVIALESDTIQYVFSRIQRHDPPVIVAIYWPETEKLTFTQMEPTPAPADYSPERDDVGGTSTIGQLWQYADRQQNAHFRFKLGWGASTTMSFARFDPIPA